MSSAFCVAKKLSSSPPKLSTILSLSLSLSVSLSPPLFPSHCHKQPTLTSHAHTHSSTACHLLSTDRSDILITTMSEPQQTYRWLWSRFTSLTGPSPRVRIRALALGIWKCVCVHLYMHCKLILSLLSTIICKPLISDHDPMLHYLRLSRHSTSTTLYT